MSASRRGRASVVLVLMLVLVTIGALAICSATVAAALPRAKKAAIARMAVEAIIEGGYEANDTGDGIEWIGPEGAELTMYLDRVFLTCETLPESQWRAFVADHVRTSIDALEEAAAFKATIHDYSQVAEYLTIRLYREGYVPDLGALVARRDIEGLVTCLTFDLTYSVSSATRANASEWNVSEDELFRAALGNTIRKYPARVSKIDLGRGISLIAAEDQNMFMSTYALDLSLLPGAMGPNGCVFAVPQTGIVIAYPVARKDANLMAVMSVIADLASQLARNSPQSLSNALYWYDGAHYVNIPYRYMLERVIVYAPEALSKLQ